MLHTRSLSPVLKFDLNDLPCPQFYLGRNHFLHYGLPVACITVESSLRNFWEQFLFSTVYNRILIGDFFSLDHCFSYTVWSLKQARNIIFVDKYMKIYILIINCGHHSTKHFFKFSFFTLFKFTFFL